MRHPCCVEVLLVVLLVGSSVDAFWLWSGASDPEPLTPIVLIPGLGGNQLDAKIDKSSVPSGCQSGWTWGGLISAVVGSSKCCVVKSDWFLVWLNVGKSLMGEECIAENLLLHYNETTRTNSNSPGVTIRVPGWGTTTTMEYLDPSWSAYFLGNMGAYAVHLVQGLLDLGYVKGRTIVGAPYDFRYAPHSQNDYFDRLRALIEKTSTENNGDAVILIAHSMGGLFMHRFLRQQTDAWKETYIEAFVTLNTPWSGAVVITHIYSSGNNWGLRAIDPLVLRTMHRTLETASLLFPTNGSWGPDDVIVQTPERNYTVANLDEYFRDINFTRGMEYLDNVRDTKEDLQHPGVDTYCLYGSNQLTPETLVYGEGEFPDKQPKILMGNGDGTVNLRSLEYCLRWENPDNKKVFYAKELPDIGHHRILDNKSIFDVLQMIYKKQLLTKKIRKNQA